MPDHKYDVTYVDFNQQLTIPAEPLVYKAQRLQVVLEKFEKLLKSSPQQFSMQNYMAALNEYTRICEQLKKGVTTDDTNGVAGEGAGRDEAAAVGAGAPAGLDTGVSADNPFTR